MPRAALRLIVAGLLATPLVAGPILETSASAAVEKLTVTVASTKPGYVTGGDVLVRLRPAGTDTPVFSAAGKSLTGSALGRGNWIVRGLRNGPSRIQVKSGDATGSVVVVNHPISGPVFSGPHLPLLCTVPVPAAEPSCDATCADSTSTEYAYKNTAGTIGPISGPDQRPVDLATVTVDGYSVPYIIRIERGVINRSPYSFAVLDDPEGWNQRLVYQFGGGCGTAYSQGGSLGTNVVDDALLTKGYAVATANFNTFQTSCNDVLSAETAMMVKEHVAETIGAPRFTIGAGASGGAIQQLLIAQNYPGILDALSPVIPFPDAISIAPGVSDCGLLAEFYASPSGQGFTDAQQTAINGHRTTGACKLWVSSFLGNIDPSTGCDSQIPADRIFSAVNPKGIRCTLQDLNRNEFGIDPATGFARRPLDNVGVQYGLRALNAGTITVDQFLDLNESIGGYDINGQPVPERETARPADFRRAYATGRVLTGGGGMRDIPIITVNLYSDPFGDIHDRFRLFTIRERLRSKSGKVDLNEKIWTRGSNGDIVQALTGNAFDPAEAVALLDTWLTSGRQPKAAADNCTDESGKVISGPAIYEKPGPCRDLYPVFGDPRTAAGAPIINDRLKCRTRPVDPESYEVTFAPQQAARLERIFPVGVCDWRKPGVGQVPLAATWINYGQPPYRATRDSLVSAR